MIKVSIIVPVYNVEKYLSKCLDSILYQTLEEIEVICIDDGSTDNCGKILDYYAETDCRVRIFTQRNAGLSCARNKGIMEARGEYVGFVDSDDWVAPDFYETLYYAAKYNDADIAAANIRRPSGRFKLRYRKKMVYFWPQQKMDAAGIPKNNYVWNKIYRREMLIPFAEDRYFEDVNWSIRMVHAANRFVVTPHTAYYYRKNRFSIMHSRTERKVSDFKWAWSEMLAFAREQRLHIKERYYMKQKTKVTFFGLTLLKGYHWSYRSRYKLFGFIPFATVERH
jgi:glycosyltransferase involved in cell wall biosynthesis